MIFQDCLNPMSFRHETSRVKYTGSTKGINGVTIHYSPAYGSETCALQFWGLGFAIMMLIWDGCQCLLLRKPHSQERLCY
jgi:hypothetical protein